MEPWQFREVPQNSCGGDEMEKEVDNVADGSRGPFTARYFSLPVLVPFPVARRTASMQGDRFC